MKLNDAIIFVLKNMIEKKSRVFLTVSGIVIGIFTFVFFVLASQGLSNAIASQFSSFGVNVLVVSPVSSGGITTGPPTGSGLTDTEIAKIRSVTSDTRYIAPVIFYNGQYEYGREKAVITSLAYPDEYWDDASEDIGIEMEKGRFLRPGDKGVAVVGAKTARDAFSRELDIGSSVKINDRSYRVIGIIKERGDLFVDSSLLLTFDDIKLLSGQDTYSGIRVSFTENADLELNKEAILRRLNPNNDEKTVSITSPDQVIEQFNSILGVLTMIISFVSSIALLVGGINVMNTMYSNVLERTNEISVMKAMGARNEDVLKLFLFESSALGFIGAFIGFIMAYGLAKGLSYIITNVAKFNVPVYFDLNLFVLVLILTTLFAALFGTYPALKGANVNPADNLRDE